MTTPRIDIPFYYHDAPHLRPSQGQILALGTLMILHYVYATPDISHADLAELRAMRLCHPYRNLTYVVVERYDISSRLLREWAPYQRYCSEWHKAFKLLASSRRSFVVQDDPAQLEFFKTSAITDFMQLLVQECGRGLATHWTAWKMEDRFQTIGEPPLG